MEKPNQSPITDEQMQMALAAKYPFQGFNGTTEHLKLAEKQIMTFTTVYNLAKAGDFDAIRPDLLVMHFRDILEIYNYTCATSVTPA